MKKYWMLSAVIITALLLPVRGGVYSRAETASPCDKAGTARIPCLLKKGAVGELTWWGNKNIGEYVRWSTSHLRAAGKPPVKAVPTEARDSDDVERDYWAAFAQWSGMYSAWSAMDGDTLTAWCEGKNDEGIGEVLIVKADTAKPVRIWNGLGAGDRLYAANNRARKIRVWVLQAKQSRTEVGQYDLGVVYMDITVLGSHEVVLKDMNGWQPLPLPPHKRLAFRSVSGKGEPVVEEGDSTFLAVEILSVYKGALYNDTCISEIGVGGDK